jgi:hypothetical protein
LVISDPVKRPPIGGFFCWLQTVIPRIPKSVDMEIHTLLMTGENSRGILLASEK